MCHHFVNHHDGLAAHAVLVIEEAALAQHDAHDLQIIRGHASCERGGLLGFRRLGGRGPVADLIVAFAHRDGIHHGDGLHSRHAAGAREHVLPGGADARGVGEGSGRKRRPRGEDIAEVDAGVKGRQAHHGTPENSGGDQQHDG